MSPVLVPKSASWISPGSGITPDDDIQGFSTSKWVFATSMLVVAVYNAIELIIMVFLTFRQYRGLYFHSLLVSGLAIVLYETGFFLHLLDVTKGGSRWTAITLITLGWWPMVTGQAVVLWSRLHLILMGGRRDRIIRRTGWMICLNVVILHLPTTVLTYGSNGKLSPERFADGYDVMEKIQMAGFFCQEMVLSTIYITETAKLLRTSLQRTARTTMRQLIAVNATIIVLDLGLLGMEAASLYNLETILKGVVYSIKLKLELAVLGKLVSIAGGSGAGSGSNRSSYGNVSAAGFVTRGTLLSSSAADHHRGRRKWAAAKGDHEGEQQEQQLDFVRRLDKHDYLLTRPPLSACEHGGSPGMHTTTSTSSSSSRGREADGYRFARFEHVEEVVSLRDCDV